MNWYKTILAQQTINRIKPNLPTINKNIPVDWNNKPILKDLKYPVSRYEVPEEDIRSQLPGMYRTPTEEDIPTLTPEDISKYLEDEIEEKETPETPEGELPPEEPEPQPEEIYEPPKKPQEEYPIFTSVIQAFDWANENKETMRISYVTKRGTFITRNIEPHGDFWARTTSNHIFVTWDETISDIRAFISSNIQKYEFMGYKFEPKFNFAPK